MATKSLFSLPNEVLVKIVDLLSGYDIGALWMLGNGGVTSCLLSSKPGVSIFCLKKMGKTISDQSIMLWPSLVSYLPNLTTFNVKTVQFGIIPLETLLTLPHSLTKLSLGRNDVSSLVPHLSSHFPALSSLSISISHVPTLMEHLWVQLNDIAPLTSLEIALGLGGRFTPELPASAAELLPRGLTCLKVPGKWHITREDILQLPPKLTKLRVGSLPNCQLNDFALIPSLTDLSVFLQTVLFNNICHLPTRWKSLRVSVERGCDFSNVQFPPFLHLLALTADSGMYIYPMTLSNSITDLKLGSMATETREVFEALDLPPGLTRLSIEHPSYIKIPILPKSLTCLSIHAPMIRNSEILDNLPFGLISLSLPCLCARSKVLSLLPKGLIALEIQMDSGNPETVDLHDLPPQLTSLISSSFPINDRTMADLPRTIETLILPWAQQLTNEMTKNLPKSLTVLDLNYNSNLSPECFQSLPNRLHYISFSKMIHRVRRRTEQI